MKTIAVVFAVAIFGSSVLAFPPAKRVDRAIDLAYVNIIEGTVYDPDHRPVPDLWVELLSEYGMGNRRVRTGSGGRFTFSPVAEGRYQIKVYTSGTNFEEQIETVEVMNVVQNGSGTFFQDVNLHLRRGVRGTGIVQMTEAVFYQEIPAEAKRLYRDGVKNLSGPNAPHGQEELEQAIQLFPDYYDALNALGCNYVDSKEYQKSLPYLIHAIDVNQRSFSSFYSLAYAAYKLNRLPEASEAARGSVILQPNSVNAQLLYGTILRILGNSDLALETLLKAEKLSKSSPVAEIHWQLAMLYSKLNRNRDAADELESYLRIAPDAPNRKQVQDLIQKLKSKTT